MFVKKVRNPAARRQVIQQQFLSCGVLSVSELCQQLDASPATIRRDLAALEQEGLIKRNYGGAALAKESPAEQEFAERQQQDREAKKALARASVELIEPGQTIFLSDGSTMIELAREIVVANKQIFVATQAVNLAQMLAASENVTVCLLGGFIRPTSFATCGPFAERMVEQINADWLFLSSVGFAPNVGLTYRDPDDVTLARAMLRQSREACALITRAKFSISAPMTAIDTKQLDYLVTERLNATEQSELNDTSVKAIETNKA